MARIKENKNVDIVKVVSKINEVDSCDIISPGALNLEYFNNGKITGKIIDYEINHDNIKIIKEFELISGLI